MDTLANRNNNPGNLRDPSTGGFRRFNSPQEGYAALLNDLEDKKRGNTSTGLGPDSTLVDFASKYAPAGDSNAPGKYAASLANQLGVRPDAKLRDLDTARWAAAVAHNEDNSSLFGSQKIVGTPKVQAAPMEGEPKDPSFLEDLGGDVTESLQGVAEAAGKAASGQINPVSGLIQAGGAIGSGITQATNTALEHTPIVGKGVKAVEGLVGQGVEKALSTDTGQKLVTGYQDFAAKHPELAGDIEGGFNIVTAIPVLKGLAAVKNLAKGALQKGIFGGVDEVADMVGPKLSGKEMANAITKQGTKKVGLMRTTVLNPSKETEEVAGAVRRFVPKLDPGKGLLHNIEQTQAAADGLGSEIKKAVIEGGKDRIYTFRELASRISNLEPDISIHSEAGLENVYARLKQAALDIARKNGGKVSTLLDTRQEFDAMIRRSFPNLYSSERLTPLRMGVRDIRKALTDFTAENLPPETGLKQALWDQHLLITAADNMAEKAASGAAKEIGTTAVDRFMGNHPVIRGIISKGGKVAAEGTGIGAFMRITE